MTENQKIKMELLKEFAHVENQVSFCREAYKFLTEDEEAHERVLSNVGDGLPIVRKDGLYVIYDDGSYAEYSDECSKENVRYIGIVYDGHSFAVALEDVGRYQLLKDGVECPEESAWYIPRECDALNDWECKEKTRHIQELGTDIPLKDGEYIPSLPMLVTMCHLAEKLNEALESVGGEPLDMNSYYWSVAESNGGAWNVGFHTGGIWHGGKYSSFVVRPVAAFNL